MIEALPVAVIYEPPQPADPALRNTAIYSRGSSIATRITKSLSFATSTSKSLLSFAGIGPDGPSG